MTCRQWVMRALVVSAVALLVGCSSQASPPAPFGVPAAKESLTDLAVLLKHLQEEGKKPPARIEDIEPVEPLFQAAYLGLVRDEIVYVWGAALDPAAADKVLAYEKAAESTSGWVLMQDGTLHTLPAADLQSAPKAAR